MAKKDKEDNKEKGAITPMEQIRAIAFSKENKHNNFLDVKEEKYKVSSGSLFLDIETQGGLGSGVHRFTGISEGGKTSCALAFARNFQRSIENAFVFWVRAEGRLDDEVLARSGVDTSEDKWCVFPCNIHEDVIDLIRELVANNPTKRKYLFVIDSMDSLIPKGDSEKTSGEANKVAGGALLTGDFLKRMSLSFRMRGHMCILISQVRSKPQIDKYAPKEISLTNGSGGHAQEHYPDWIFEFQHHFNKDSRIWEGEAGRSKIIGHYCNIVFRKSVLEKTGRSVAYPIKYGRTNGNSVWVEREIFSILLSYDFFEKNGAWIKVKEDFKKQLIENKLEIPDQLQGIEKWYNYLEENQPLTNYLYNYILNNFVNAPTSKDDNEITEA